MRGQRKLSTNNQNRKGLQLLFATVPLLLSFIISLIAFFAAVFIRGALLHSETTTSEAADDGIVYLINYSLHIIIFGFWYTMILQERAPFSGNVSTEAGKTSKKKSKNSGKEPEEWHPVKYWAKRLPILLLIGYGLQLCVSGIIAILSTAFPDLFASYKELIQSLAGTDIDWMTFLSVSFLAPIGEELLFRGVVFHYAKGAMKLKPAIIFQAILFGIYHMNLIQFVYAVVIGYLLGVLAERAGSILPGIVLHIIINLSAYLIPGVFIDNIPKAALCSVLALGIVIPCCIVMLKKPKSKKRRD